MVLLSGRDGLTFAGVALAVLLLALLLAPDGFQCADALRIGASAGSAGGAGRRHGGGYATQVSSSLFKPKAAPWHHGTMVLLQLPPEMQQRTAPGQRLHVTARDPHSAPPPLHLGFEARVRLHRGPEPTSLMQQAEEIRVAFNKRKLVLAIQPEEPAGHAGRPAGGVVVDVGQALRYESQPFFDELVCFAFDLSGHAEDPPDEEDAAELFLNYAAEALGVPLRLYEDTEQHGSELMVNGHACRPWSTSQVRVLPVSEASQVLATMQGQELFQSLQADLADNPYNGNFSIEVNATFCVDSDGHLLASNASKRLSVLQQNKSRVVKSQATRMELHALRNISDDALALTPQRRAAGGRCLDLTSAGARAKDMSQSLNDQGRLHKINAEAKGAWKAAPYHGWLNVSVSDIVRSLGTGIRPLRLPLRSAARPCEKALAKDCRFTISLASKPPKTFDSRTRWKRCSSIRTIRNQGQCGSCWAFAASGVLADRFCIAAARANATGFDNLTLSPQYLLDCDDEDGGCSGGHLDDAWQFLQTHGISEESCDPYLHCPRPADTLCGMEDPSNQELMQMAHAQERTCPRRCVAAHSQPRIFHATSAYAVSAPGDVEAMQQEMLTNGPVEAAFFVFSDFHSYRSGTYFRTPSAVGPLGGHAVRLIGWGVDKCRTAYWTVANSFGRKWGMKGFFRIRRGTNECGIETMPAAGLPELSFDGGSGGRGDVEETAAIIEPGDGKQKGRS